MSCIVDASVIVAAFVDAGTTGQWAESVVAAGDLHAPHLMPFEVANILRRAELAGDVSPDVSALAHADLRDLPVRLIGYEAVAERVWELRGTVTAYDAAYVALAELLDMPLATLDRRLSRAPGTRCPFLLPG